MRFLGCTGFRILFIDGCSGHGPIRAFVSGVHRIGFSWNSFMTRWDRPGLPGLSNLAGPIQHVQSAILDAWRNKVAADLCAPKGLSWWSFA